MNRASSTERPARGAQRGDALLEALIGIVLMAVIGLGLSYAAVRVLNGQRYTSTQNMAVMQMRNMLAANPGIATFCTGAANISVTLDRKAQTPTEVVLPATINCSPASAISVVVAGNATFNETVNFLTRVSVSTPGDSTAIGLFGGDGIVTVSQ